MAKGGGACVVKGGVHGEGRGHAWQGGMHGKGGGVRGMHDRSLHGRYAFYWNAFFYSNQIVCFL